MRNTLELLICGTIGGYCLWRCAAVMPGAIAEAHALVEAYLGRAREIEQLAEPAE